MDNILFADLSIGDMFSTKPARFVKTSDDEAIVVMSQIKKIGTRVNLPANTVVEVLYSRTDDREDDDTEIIQWGELRRLRKVFETSSDLVLSCRNREFRDAVGGIKVTMEAHNEAVRLLEQWYGEGDDAFCQ